MIENVYRPGSGVYPPFFAGRDREIKVFKEKLESTVKGVPMHLAIVGDYAMGKTVLLKKFEETAGEACFTYRCIAGAENTQEFFTSLIRGISLKAKEKYGESLVKRLANKISLRELKVSVFEAGFAFNSLGEAQLTFKEYLRKLWMELKQKTKAIVLFIDDVDSVQDFKNTMMTLRNTAMELQEECKIMVVIAGTLKVYDKMHEAHAPLVRFFEPIELEHLTTEETKQAIIEPAKRAGVTYENEVVEKIAKYSCGQPYYLQEISYHVFEAGKNKNKIGLTAFELGFQQAFSDITKLAVQQRVEKLSKNEVMLLATLEPKQPTTYTEIINNAKTIPKTSAATALFRLKKKGFVKQIQTGLDKNKYQASDSMLLLFVKKLAAA